MVFRHELRIKIAPRQTSTDQKQERMEIFVSSKVMPFQNVIGRSLVCRSFDELLLQLIRHC